MADHLALGRLGWGFGAVTAAVLLTAMMVTSHADQRPSDGASRFVAAAAPSASAYDLATLFQPR